MPLQAAEIDGAWKFDGAQIDAMAPAMAMQSQMLDGFVPPCNRVRGRASKRANSPTPTPRPWPSCRPRQTAMMGGGGGGRRSVRSRNRFKESPMSTDAPSSRRELKPGEPLLRHAKMHQVTPAAPVTGTVVENRRCTANKKAATSRSTSPARPWPAGSSRASPSASSLPGWTPMASPTNSASTRSPAPRQARTATATSSPPPSNAPSTSIGTAASSSWRLQQLPLRPRHRRQGPCHRPQRQTLRPARIAREARLPLCRHRHRHRPLPRHGDGTCMQGPLPRRAPHGLPHATTSSTTTSSAPPLLRAPVVHLPHRHQPREAAGRFPAHVRA